MNRSVWIFSGLLALLLALAALWFFTHHHRVSEETRLPPTGEASYNPLYALQQSLRAQGIKTESRPWLILPELQLGARDTLVLYAQQQALAPDQARKLLDWVEAGGHLVMPAPLYAGDDSPLVQALKLQAVYSGNDDGDWEENCHELPTGVVSPKPGNPDNGKPGSNLLYLCEPRFRSELPGFVYGDGDSAIGYRFGRLSSAQGVISVVSGLDFLNNGMLETPVARELAHALLAPRLGQGRMHLIYSADVPSWWRLLLQHGWPALLPLLLALLAWLAWRSQRLGPVLATPPGHRRALLEHVRAAGEFAYQRQRGSALHTAVLALFRKRLARREPLIAALDGETQIIALAERLAMDPARIRRSLRPIGLNAPDAFLESISTLIEMRNRL